jgi:hypothetical protein
MMIGLASGSVILVVVILVILAGVTYGFYTRTGSGIETRPWDGEDGAPGAEGRAEVSGSDQGEGSAFDTHGTR